MVKTTTKMKKAIIFLLPVILIFIFSSGCGVVNIPSGSMKTATLDTQYLNAVAYAIIQKNEADNAATAAVVEMTLIAATTISPRYSTDAASACQKIVNDINIDKDYSAIKPGANLSGCDFSGIDLFGMPLIQTDLRATNLSDANLTGANLTGADLTFANLTKTRLRFAILTNAILIGANFANADLTSADLRGAVLTNADFKGADLTSTIVTQEQLNQAANLKSAILPLEFGTPIP